MKIKVCNICNIEKPLSEFPRRGLSFRCTCKACTNAKNKPLIKASKEKNKQHYRDLKNSWEKEQRLILSYRIMQKEFITQDEFVFVAKQRLLILKRNIKKYEKLQRDNSAAY